MFLLTLALWTVLCSHVELEMVKVEQGLLRGSIRSRSTGNGQFYSFKGIPYAAPPVGKLRFKAPRPPKSWEGERNATEHGPICPQAEFGTGEYIAGNEDCLYLNVYTPTIDTKASLSVMVFIHGGGYVSGSGNEGEYGPAFLLDQNVILVTMNYRVGALGFLCLDIKEAPGNAGLKDQAAALRWVKTNIDKFGGNPNNVTIFGQQSGGSAVTLHALSPMSKGLFKRGAAMSGVYLNDFALPFERRRHGLLLSHKIGFYTQDPQEAFRFLQKAPVKDIVTSRPDILSRDVVHEYVSKYHDFPPVVENDFGDERFMPECPQKLIRNGKTNDVELMLGHTAMEGTQLTIALKKEVFKAFPYFAELIVPKVITAQLGAVKTLPLADLIKNHYFGKKEVSVENIKEFIRLLTYLVYVYDIHRFLEMWTKSGNTAYFYEFSCFSDRNVYGKRGVKYGVKAATHLDDIFYLFDGKDYYLPIDRVSDSYKMVQQTSTLYTNFAKYGNPTPDSSLGVTWEDYGKNGSFLDINLNLTLKPVSMEEINFWRKVFYKAGIEFS